MKTWRVKLLTQSLKLSNLPVTLKMRTGWDDDSRNAPFLAKIAENAGVQMITVHGADALPILQRKSRLEFHPLNRQ